MSLDVEIRSLSTPTVVLVRNLSFQVLPGTVYTLMGASGSGKSSILAAVCGTLSPELQFEGSVTLNGNAIESLPTQTRHVGILFQDDLLFAHMTVRENLLFALAPGVKAEREERVALALADVEMQAHLHSDPATLSGGQRSRISLARTLLAQPRALLLDEPFSRLDAALRARMRELVFGLVRVRNIPALLVTHDAADIADTRHMTTLSPERQ